MKTVCDIIAAASAFGAAGFWFWSAAVRIPDTLDMKLSGPESPSGYMKKQSRYGAIGAILAGVAAAAQGIGLIVQISN